MKGILMVLAAISVLALAGCADQPTTTTTTTTSEQTSYHADGK